MANSLTGNYEAVFQIAIRQINGLLGTLHQNAAIKDAPLKLLHSSALRIGDPPRRRPDVDAFGDWLIEYQKAGPGRGLDTVRAELTAKAPPGAVQMLTEALEKFDRDWVIHFPPDVVRGTVKLQVSCVKITIPDGSSSEVTLHARVRAHYYPDPDTTDLPAPVSGDIRAFFDVLKVQFPSVTKLYIQPSSQDSKIQFIAAPGAGLNAADETRITVELRKILREGLSLLPVDLPADFPFADFKGLGSGPSRVIALPFQLSGANQPAGGLQSLTQAFIGSSGFAFAVSREYVSGLIDVEAIRQALKDRELVFKVGGYSITYRLRFSLGPALTFKSGGIEISGRVEAETDTIWAPNGFVSFKQLVMLVLDTAVQTVSLQRIAEPNVDQSWFIPHGTAVNIVKAEIDKALSANAAPIRRIFTNAKSALLRGLKTFDVSATALYTAVEITPDGVIVRGDIGSAARNAPVVEVSETHQGAAFTAFRSWIPGGRIDRFIWSWVEHSGVTHSVWSGIEKSLTDEHRFVFPKPAGITEISQLCLRIEGTRTMPGGHEVNIAAGTVCHVAEPKFTIDLPSWWEPLTLPIWQPELAETTPLKEAIAGHMSIEPIMPGTDSLTSNTLVYFADWRLEKPLDSLSVALRGARDSSVLVVVVVLPAGAFDSPRADIESRVPHENTRASMQFTEDDEGAWTRVFAVTTKPSVYLINAKREFVWKHEGEPDPAELAAALDKHLLPTPATRFRPLRLAVSPGDSAPDVSFEDQDRQQFALHRLRGRRVLMNFWQSWSAPCLVELSRLQRLYQADRETQFIVAFDGSKNGNVLEVRKQLGLSFPLVQDSLQRIARRYGVRCWPTTIIVDSEGSIEHIQLGIGHEHQEIPLANQSKPAESSL